MERQDYLTQLTGDARALSAVLATADLDTVVPSCPDWRLMDLARHVAAVYQHKIAAIRTGHRPDPWPPEPAEGIWQAPIREFLDASIAGLLHELSTRDPAAACWTWYSDDQTVGFWVRRMAQETVIHRWDAENAVGQASQIGSEIAADGIDELLVAFLSGDWSDDRQPGPYGTVEIRAGDGRWRVQLDPEEVMVQRRAPDVLLEVTAGIDASGASADAVIRATEPNMLLALWGRRPLPAAQGSGQALVDALATRLAMVTQ